MQIPLALAVLASMVLGFEDKEQILAAVLANESALSTFSCRVTTEVTPGKGAGYTAHGFVIRRPNYLRVVSQSPERQSDFEIDGDVARMIYGSSSLQVMPLKETNGLTSDTDWFFLTRQRIWGPSVRIEFLSEMIQNSGDKLRFGESKEGPTISFVVNNAKCQLTLSRRHNLVPMRLTWTNTFVHERKPIHEVGSVEALEFHDESPGVFIPKKIKDVVKHGDTVVLTRTSVAEKISLLEKDQQLYPPFRFPANTMISDSVRREIYQLREDGTRAPVFRNGKEVKGVWYREERDEFKSPAMLKIHALSAKIPSEFSPWPWLAGGLATFAGIGFAIWCWRRRTLAGD